MNIWRAALAAGSMMAMRSVVAALEGPKLGHALRTRSSAGTALPALGFFLGGAAIALLFAPTSGADLRAEISRRMSHARGTAVRGNQRARLGPKPAKASSKKRSRAKASNHRAPHTAPAH